jgi:hypothetical protein
MILKFDNRNSFLFFWKRKSGSSGGDTGNYTDVTCIKLQIYKICFGSQKQEMPVAIETSKTAVSLQSELNNEQLN